MSQLAGCTDDCAASYSALLMLHVHAMSVGDFDAAEGRIQQLLALRSIMVPELRAAVATDAAYFYAWVRHDAARGRALLEDARSAPVAPYALAQAEAAVALVDGDRSLAARRTREGLEALPAAPFPGIRELDRRRLQELLCTSEVQAGAVSAETAAAPGV